MDPAACHVVMARRYEVVNVTTRILRMEAHTVTEVVLHRKRVQEPEIVQVECTDGFLTIFLRCIYRWPVLYFDSFV